MGDVSKSPGKVTPDAPTYPWPSTEVGLMNYANSGLLLMIAAVLPYRCALQLTSPSVLTGPKTSYTNLGTTTWCKGSSILTSTPKIP